jgi:2-dehydropantoate 2-reductase
MMKIAMIGAGAAGSVFASYLKMGGADMWLVDRYKAHMDKVAADGMTFRTPGCEFRLTGFHTAPSAESIGKMDVVILMVKATQTDSVMPAVMPCIGESTVVVSLQNGLGNEDVLAKYLPKSRILYGFGTIGTELPEPAVCVSKPESGVIMRFGAAEASKQNDETGKYLEFTFNNGGCSASYEEDIRPYVWKKAISNSGYNTVSAVSRMKVGPLLADENGRDIVLQVWKEGCQVAKAAGVRDLWPEMQEELPRLQAGFATYYPSMAQDVVIHQRQTEIALLNGKIAEYGEKYGVPTPANSLLTKLVSCMQANYGAMYGADNA